MSVSWAPLLLASLAGPAWAAQPDAAAYDAAADALLAGPPGCWEVVGEASYRWDGHRNGYVRGDAAFVGRLEDGAWTGFLVRSLGEWTQERQGLPPVYVWPHQLQRFLPLVGNTRGFRVDLVQDRVEDPTNTVIQATDPEPSSVTEPKPKPKPAGRVAARWNEASQGVQFVREVRMGQHRADVGEVEVFFPGGELLPVSAEVRYPATLSTPAGKVRDARAVVRGQVLGGTVFPAEETLTFRLPRWGHDGQVAQTVRYHTFRPCGGPWAPEIEAIGTRAPAGNVPVRRTR